MEYQELICDSFILIVIFAKFLAIVTQLDQRIGFGKFVLYIGSEVLVLQFFASIDMDGDWMLNLAAFLISMSSSYCLLAGSLVRRQLTLTAQALTYKEMLSRDLYFNGHEKVDPRQQNLSFS
jgi:hypothetical protein